MLVTDRVTSLGTVTFRAQPFNVERLSVITMMAVQR